MDDSAGPRLRALYNSVRPQVERYWRLYASTIINELHRSVTEHNEIIDAIRRGDPEAVEHTLQKNWMNGLQRISGLIDVFGERGSW
jgi:DNA-binding FadR family transcriptional regulator